MTNILEAIYNIANYQNFEIKNLYKGRIRANNIGEALESYVKDAFAGTLGTDNEIKKLETNNENFSWLGNQNNPPDLMIKGGDAIEVKKTQTANNGIQLNSSYPKATIKSSSTLISDGYRNCEDWTERDIIYAIGHTNDSKLKSLWMVYGNIYAAKHETYQRIKDTIKNGITSIPDVEFAETKEIGGVKRVDPLGITNLRIRGMWKIENPRKVFDYLHQKTKKEFELVCIIPIDKYNNFPLESKSKIESLTINGFEIKDSRVKDPNNPANLINCKLIKFVI